MEEDREGDEEAEEADEEEESPVGEGGNNYILNSLIL